MKRLFALVGMLLACGAYAQDFSDFEPIQPGIVVNIPELIAKPWIDLGSNGADSYAYQMDHSIHYTSKGATPENKTHDVILKMATKGPSGEVSHVSLVAFSLICWGNGGMADSIFIQGETDYHSGASQIPDAGHLNFVLNPYEPKKMDVPQGSIFALVGKHICN